MDQLQNNLEEALEQLDVLTEERATLKAVATVDQLSTAANARSMEWVFFFILYNKDVIQAIHDYVVRTPLFEQRPGEVTPSRDKVDPLKKRKVSPTKPSSQKKSKATMTKM